MPKSEKGENGSASKLEVKVCDAFPWRSAVNPLNEVIAAHDGDIRMAFAYAREIAVDLLSPYVDRLNRPGSYLIAAPESATCDRALAQLDRLAPDFVYFHHGRPGVRQKESPKRRGIMHSKVALSIGEKNATAWVGSHNLSENALLGINAEIAIRIKGPRDHKVLLHIEKHLEALRDTAEKWAPRPGDVESEDEEILVVHAFKEDPSQIVREFVLRNEVFIHCSLPSVLASALTDETTKTRRRVHLHIYKNKAELRKEVDPEKSSNAWWGEITTDSHAQEDNRHPGADGEFSEICFEIQWPDEKSPPTIVSSKGVEAAKGGPKQIVIRVDGLLDMRDIPIEYSIGKKKVIEDRKRSPIKSKHPSDVPPEFDKYLKWTLGNEDKKYIHFEGAQGKGKVKVAGFESKAAREWIAYKRKLIPSGYDYKYRQLNPKTELHRYFYLSTRQWRKI